MRRPGLTSTGMILASVRRRRRDLETEEESQMRITEDDIPRITEDGEIRYIEGY